ncbi:Histidinol-phosphate aminotransferase [Castellaniella defragrans]
MPPNFDSLPFAEDTSGTALYRQIADWIEHNIHTGTWPVGDRLPTVRAMAEHLSMNRGAVASAYALLIRKGVLTARVGRGTYVAAPAAEIAASHAVPAPAGQFWDPLLVKTANRLGLQIHVRHAAGSDAIWIPDRGEAAEGQSHIPLDMPLADHSQTVEPIRHAIRMVADQLGKRLLSYNHPQGAYELRESIAQLASRRHIRIRPEDVMIVNGAQDALSLIVHLLVQPDDVVITENPSYPGAIRAFRMAKANVIGIPVDQDGIRTDLLEEILKSHTPSLIYTIPSFQAPTGATQSHERRAELYALAAKHHVPIVEDEYVNDLYYGEPPPTALKSIDEQQLVIYVGTFSKTLGAGMRLGWVAAPSGVITQLAQIKEARDIHSSIFAQLIVDHLLRDGLYEEMLTQLRDHYRVRHDRMRSAIAEHLGLDPVRYKYSGGFSLWTQLPPGISSADWLVYARVRGAPFERGAGYFLSPEKNDHFVKFCFSLLTPKEIDMAIDILADSLKELSGYRGNTHQDGGGHFLPFS